MWEKEIFLTDVKTASRAIIIIAVGILNDECAAVKRDFFISWLKIDDAKLKRTWNLASDTHDNGIKRFVYLVAAGVRKECKAVNFNDFLWQDQ